MIYVHIVTLDSMVIDREKLSHVLVDFHVVLMGFWDVSVSYQVAKLPQDVVEVIPS